MAIGVGLVSFALYWPTRQHGFLDFDDGLYVTHCEWVREGFAWGRLKQVLTANVAANWHPMTMLSLMADGHFFGIENAGAFHLHNAALHAAAAALLFLFILTLVGKPRAFDAAARESRSPGTDDGSPAEGVASGLDTRAQSGYLAPTVAALAALFWSLHPLRVESVAWVSSRKDVLSGVFCVLGLMAWLKNVRHDAGGAGRYCGWTVFSRHSTPPSARAAFVGFSFLATLLCFIAGYLSKPTMMVFPAYLALVEWLETGRVRWRPMVLMGALAAGLLVVTMGYQAGAVSELPWGTRLGNAAISISVYVRQTVWPSGLSCFYMFHRPLDPVSVGIGLAVVLTLAALAAGCWRRMPWVSFAIGWFVLGLVPMLGLVHVGSAAHADRYTYLPAMGLSVALAGMAGARGLRGRSQATGLLLALACVVLIGYASASFRYQRSWRDTESLFSRAVALDPRNPVALTTLGNVYFRDPARHALAGAYYQRAVDAYRDAQTLGNLALWTLLKGGDAHTTDAAGAMALEAMMEIMARPKAVRLKAEEIGAWHGLAYYRLLRGDAGEAEGLLRESLPADPYNPVAHEWLGMACYKQGKWADALIAIETAQRLAPGNEKFALMIRDLKGKLAHEK
jgi:Flp pilus assembly protein TadD